MQVYSGNVAKASHLELVRRHGWGRMVSAVHWRTPRDDLPWAFDNGAYSAFVQGKRLDIQPYVRQMMRLAEHSPPDFTVVPDIVSGGFESLRFSLSHTDCVWWHVPAYLAVQDGLCRQDVEPILQFFDGIFVGGTAHPSRSGNNPKADHAIGRSSGWKWDTAQGWVSLAHEHGLKCHIGKVGTYHDLVEARRIGADSVDSTSWAVNDKHWIPEAALQATVKPARPGHGQLPAMARCGHLEQDDDWGLMVCRLDPGHAGEHGLVAFYEYGSPPSMANDRGPEAFIDAFENVPRAVHRVKQLKLTG
jgi:hypothetical protein